MGFHHIWCVLRSRKAGRLHGNPWNFSTLSLKSPAHKPLMSEAFLHISSRKLHFCHEGRLSPITPYMITSCIIMITLQRSPS
jgi:hypothetical protein